VRCHPTGLLSRVMLSLATAECGWMVLTTAVPSGACDSRANHHRNRRAGDEREGKCSKKDELLHNGLFLSEAQLASSGGTVAPSGNGECDVQHNKSLPQLFVASAKRQSETEHNGAFTCSPVGTRNTIYRLFNFSLRQPGSSLTLRDGPSSPWRLPIGIADDEACLGLLDGPGRRESARHGELAGRNVVIVIGHDARLSGALRQVAVGC